MEKIRLAIIGLGLRGKGTIKGVLLENERCEVVALCDEYQDRIDETEALIKEKTDREVPIKTTDYKELLTMKDKIDAICVLASWECHIEIAVASMKAGIPVAIEVGGAYSVEDCFELVRTQVATGTKFMFLENCCYGRVELAVLNMVKKGLFGEIVHCEGGYQHDLRNQVLLGEENRHYRLRNYMARNCDNYPMHALGPVARILGINEGNRMLYLTSMASKAVGLNDYASLHPELYQSKFVTQKFNQGDVVTTNIMCESGATITLTLNTTCAHPYSRHFDVQGTRARYCDEGKYFFFDTEFDRRQGEKFIENLNNQSKYLEKYDHPIWERFLNDGVRGGHGGMDWLLYEAFFDYIEKGGKSPIDVYDAAAWMAITPLSAKSIELGSMPVEIPDFTLIK